MPFQGKERKNYFFILAISVLQATVNFFFLFWVDILYIPKQCFKSRWEPLTARLYLQNSSDELAEIP